MKNSYSYFKNDKCEAFPCHKGSDTGDFNCLFCFCPLYHLADCGGSFSFTSKGIKDCSACTLPHKPENYQYIIDRLKNI